jgi:hypothetical protein
MTGSRSNAAPARHSPALRQAPRQGEKAAVPMVTLTEQIQLEE